MQLLCLSSWQMNPRPFNRSSCEGRCTPAETRPAHHPQDPGAGWVSAGPEWFCGFFLALLTVFNSLYAFTSASGLMFAQNSSLRSQDLVSW